MADDEAGGVVLAVFSNFPFTFCGLIFDAGLQNPLYKRRMFAVSEDPGRILHIMHKKRADFRRGRIFVTV